MYYQLYHLFSMSTYNKLKNKMDNENVTLDITFVINTQNIHKLMRLPYKLSQK